MYKVMEADEYDCEVNEKMTDFVKSLDGCEEILRTTFA